MIYKLKYVNDRGDEVEFSWESRIIISTATGFTENNIALSLSQGVNQIGSSVLGHAVQSKDIVITGLLAGETLLNRRLLLRAIVPNVPARLIYNDEWEIRVFPTLTPIIEKHVTNAKFQFSLKAPFPYWNSITNEAASLTQIGGLFTFPWDLRQAYSFGYRTQEAYVNVNNHGDINAPYKVIFTATEDVVNPSIHDVITNEYLRILKPMSVGEVITVDVTTGGLLITVRDREGNEHDGFAYIDINSNLYSVRPGNNFLRYDAAENREGLDVDFYFTVLRVVPCKD